jgi:hypothetical protein
MFGFGLIMNLMCYSRLLICFFIRIGSRLTHPTRTGDRTISQWSATKAKQVLKSLKSIGWKIKRQTSSHKILERSSVGMMSFLLSMMAMISFYAFKLH